MALVFEDGVRAEVSILECMTTRKRKPVLDLPKMKAKSKAPQPVLPMEQYLMSIHQEDGVGRNWLFLHNFEDNQLNGRKKPSMMLFLTWYEVCNPKSK